MDNFLFYYIESILFCVIFLILLLIRTLKGIDLQLKQIFFAKILFFYLLYNIVDIFWICFEIGILKNSIVHFIFNLISYIIGSVSTFYWFIYSEIVQGNRYVLSKTNRIKLAAPLMIIIFLSLIFFILMEFMGLPSLNKDFYYYYFIITTSTPVVYVVMACISSFRRAGKKENIDNKNIYIVMGIYPVVLFIGVVLQLIFLYFPIACYVITLDLLCVYLSNLENLVSIDSLTKLNNRNQFNRYISRSMKEGQSKKWIFFIDVDNFKKINDTYGHLEGDKALITVSNGLKMSCKNTTGKYFIARYGGDEFIIIANEKDMNNPEEFKETIEDSLKKICKKDNIKYKLTVSVGQSLVDFKNDSVENCLNQADNMLYIAKGLKHKKYANQSV